MSVTGLMKIRSGLPVLFWALVISALCSVDACQNFDQVLNTAEQLVGACRGVVGYIKGRSWSESATGHEDYRALVSAVEETEMFMAFSEDAYKSDDKKAKGKLFEYERWTGLDAGVYYGPTFGGRSLLKVEDGRVFELKNRSKAKEAAYDTNPVISIWRKKLGTVEVNNESVDKYDYIFAIRGTKTKRDLTVSDKQIARNGPKGENERLQDAIVIARAALRKMGDPQYFTIQTCGHSLGGYVSAILFHEEFKTLFNEEKYKSFAAENGYPIANATSPEDINAIVEDLLIENFSVNPGSSCWKGPTFEMWKGIVANEKVKIIRRRGDFVSGSMRVFFGENQKDLGNIHELLAVGQKSNILEKHTMDQFFQGPKGETFAEKYKMLEALNKDLSNKLPKMRKSIRKSISKINKRVSKTLVKIKKQEQFAFKEKQKEITEMGLSDHDRDLTMMVAMKATYAKYEMERREIVEAANASRKDLIDAKDILVHRIGAIENAMDGFRTTQHRMKLKVEKDRAGLPMYLEGLDHTGRKNYITTTKCNSAS